MKDSYLTLMQEEIHKIPYQQAMEMSGYAQGYIDHAKQNSTHAFDDKFVDSVMVLCQFVKENHPMPYEIRQLPLSSENIEELLKMDKLEIK